MPNLKKYFVTGLLILVPLGITVWVLNLIVSTMDQTLKLVPPSIRNEFPFNIPGTGVILTFAIVLGVGILAHNFIGRRLVLWWEALLRRIPVVSSIYTSVKQVSDTLFSPSGQAFRKAVLVEFPRDGAWSVAFVVGDPGEALKRPLGSNLLTVYVPTAPNPTSGYILILPPEQILDIGISVDDALKFVVSMGVVTPNGKNATTAPDARLSASSPN
ncbi:MAG: DUF502 domain-containing protein [Burkholderiaceae bacterium]